MFVVGIHHINWSHTPQPISAPPSDRDSWPKKGEEWQAAETTSTGGKTIRG